MSSPNKSELNTSEDGQELWGQNLDGYLKAMTALSIQHRIGISGDAVLYEMEQDDFDRTYRADEESRLDFI